MIVKEYPRLGEKIYRHKLSNGLEVVVASKPDHVRSYAFFATRYGGMDIRFQLNGRWLDTPAGIAHYLEHKMFDTEECNALQELAKNGASENAFTSCSMTAYYLTCTEKFYENLRILLSFVSVPYFTQESVDKEQGIIGQEIKMTNDNPEWRVFFNMLRCMYHNHPVKIDIAGTVESIAKIDADLLYKCYYTFYNLNNMTLSIAGNISADEVLAICDECLRPCEDKGLETVFPDEPESVVEPEIYEIQPVGASIFHIGYKCRPCSGQERLRKSMTASAAISLISDASTEMYKKLLDDGVINSSFGGEVFAGDGYFSVIFSGESDSPEIIRDSIREEIGRLLREGINEKDFQRIRKSAYGMAVRELNNVEVVANLMINSHMDGVGPYDSIEALSEMTSQDVLDFIRNELEPDKLVMSVIKGE